MSDIINFNTKQGLEMFDALSRTNSSRQIKPLSRENYIKYDHRQYYDTYNLIIGDVHIMIPPEFIYVTSESFSQNIQTLRQENSQKQKTGYHKRTVNIDLVFNGIDEINGYKVPGPVHNDGDKTSSFYYVDGLRTLLAQFKLTPFLPITNSLLNDSYHIYVVALQSITMETIEGFQNAMMVHLTLQEIDMMPYIEMPNIMFEHTIDWDLFRYYTQSIITENHVYKNLQSLPVNRDHTAFKLSVLNESAIQTVETDAQGNVTGAHTVKDKKSGKSKEETILEKVIDPENYAILVDSETMDVHIVSFQCSYSNMLTSIQMSDSCSPTLQYLGGLDTYFAITFETTEETVIGKIEQCQIINDLMVRNNPKVRGSIGFVKLEADFVTFCGSLFCTIESVESHTVPGIPGLYQVRMLCVSYDIAQSRREALNGFLPFNGHVSNVNELSLQGEELKEALGMNINQCIDQSLEGLMKKIYQDNYAEWKLRTTMEVYPDLRLPTYQEVNQAIANINSFRKYNNKDQLPYTKYPIQPTNIMYGNGDARSSYPNDWCNEGGQNVRDNKNVPYSTRTYDIYVDPDFYVFYPNTYLGIYNEELEAENAEKQSSGSASNTYKYSDPNKTTSFSGQTESKVCAAYYDGEDTDPKITKFISILKAQLGKHYCASAEGEVSDYLGRMFDDPGLITFALKCMGILPMDFKPLSCSGFDKLDIFKKVSTQDIRKGDIIVNASRTECGVCIGLDKTGNIAVIKVNQIDGVTEEQLFYDPANVYRIMPLQEDNNTQGTKNTNPYNSDGNQYPDENGEILEKPKKAIETTEGYESDNPYGDDNQDSRGYNSGSEGSSNSGGSSGGGNTIDQDLGVWSPITAQELNNFIASKCPDSPFNGHGNIFVRAGKESGLDPRYILAHAIQESGWGKSKIARNKHNYFGIAAYDGSAYSSSYSYNGKYNQRTLRQMNSAAPSGHKYSGPVWEEPIAKLMDSMPNNLSAHYLSSDCSENPDNGGGSQTITNTEQIKINEYIRRNRSETGEQLAKETAPVQLNQADISGLSIPEIEDDGSEWSDGSITITEYKEMTIDEFNGLARTVASECEGESLACKMAMAQLLYNLSGLKYDNGGLTLITQSEYFKSDKGEVEEKDLNEAKSCIQRVFQAGARWKKDWQVLGFTSVSNSNFADQYREAKYKKIKSEDQHIFWGYDTPGSTVGYNIQGYGVSKSSSNDTTIVRKYSVNALDIKDTSAFGKPIYIKPDYFDSHEAYVGESFRQLNSDLNRLNTSFVDDCQYSAKGRMVKAFPAFLFCILDDNAQWYDGRKLWTNYYTYKPVVNISYHAANDMPTETAQITVTNTFHNLDRSSAALVNYSIDKDEEYDNDYIGIPGAIVPINLNKVFHINRWLYKNFGMIAGGLKITNRLIQMHSIIHTHTRVREGARVHLRMGYGSDPMSLAPVINGTISGMTLGDQINIIVTSDGHELIQDITSDKTKDLNNGVLGLFGLGANQQASNIIAEILYARQSWINHLFFGGKWYEGSKYHIEHFGLYLNSGSQYMFQGGIDVGLYEQYDLMMNIYNAATKKGWFAEHRHGLYMYNPTDINDGEEPIVFNKYNMTPWDVFQLCAQCMPEFLIKVEKYQFDSRIYYGLPFDLTKYRYDIIDGTIYQECKANTQMHYLDSLSSIIENQLSVTSKRSFTNAKVIYTRGKTPKATPIIHSDDTIDNSKQSTRIIDSCITQDYLLFDAIYEFTGLAKHGKECARKLGISNLLYGWQQQYQGQILCLGMPHVKPDDYLMVNDFYTALNGLCMVREVIHSFNTSTGFTTSIIPGVIGFSPEQESGNIELIASFLKLYAAFSEYSQSRKILKENCERYAEEIALIDKSVREFNSANNVVEISKTLSTLTTIWKNVELGALIYKTVRAVKNAGSIIKAIKQIYDVYKVADTAMKTIKVGKAFTGSIKLISSINAVSKGVTAVKGSLMAAGAASAPATLGIGFAVSLIVSIAIDVIMNVLSDWLMNRNTCTLLPLWWEGEPFISGVKDGEKILLIPSSSTGSEENTGEEGRETDEEEIALSEG